MSVTPWDEIVGYTCIDCGKWATHFYFGVPTCCKCHINEVDLGMEREAIRMNDRFQRGLPLFCVDEEV